MIIHQLPKLCQTTEINMTRYKCIIEYDGTNFSGWQRQSHHYSIQQSIEEAIKAFCGEDVQVTASGRTDAGVHARGQVIHFDLAHERPEFKVMSAVNHHLQPNPIAIIECNVIHKEFHARFSSLKRFYEYKIVTRRAPLTIDSNRAWHIPVALDIEKMREGAKYLLGQHDFTSFRDSECQAKSPIKTIDNIVIEQNGNNISIKISAQSFLHHMVRNITGTLRYVGEGKFTPQDIEKILDAKDRTKAGPTAPACGLYFMGVEYGMD